MPGFNRATYQILQLRQSHHQLKHASGPGGSQLVSAELEKIEQSLDKLEKLIIQHDHELEEFRALTDVGKAINSSLHPTTVLNKVMDTIISLTGAERGFLMLRDQAGELIFRVARNLDRQTIDQSAFEISRTVVTHVANSGEALLTTNAQEDTRFNAAQSVHSYQLLSILCVPLKLKGLVTGVIYADSRLHTNVFQERDRDLLASFADQAAIAIENAQLFESLQDSKVEVETAYDATLEGWALALELRDKETEGHTRRVTEITVQLAELLDFADRDLVHVKRGALLHDIGKIGIPDRILQKPGRLTDDEWQIMKRHPVYAFELLYHIPYLLPALDIPYCHHEKWNGEGYPRGLSGEDIPRSARVFSVIDVWDALSSDRVYRQAWPHEKVITHLREQAGNDFDPQIINVFLDSDLVVPTSG